MCLHSAKGDVDYTDTVNKYFGRKGWIMGMVVFIVNLLVPIIIYIQLLAQTLYPNLLLIDNAINGTDRKINPKTFKNLDFTHMSYTWTCFIVFFGVFLVTMRKDLEIFIKLNFFGAWMIFVVIAFVLGYGFIAFSNTKYEFVMGSPPKMDFHTDKRYISLFNYSFAPLMGMLGGGYYLHNISIPIARTAKNQETATKDVMLGYFACCMSYLICGTIGLFGFYGVDFKNYYLVQNAGAQVIDQDIFNMLDAGNPIAIIVRLCVFFHLFTIMSLIFANERALIFLLAYGKQEIDSRAITYGLNLALLIPGLLLSILYPEIGELAGYLASISGFLCIYAMPSIVYMRQKYIEANDPQKGRVLSENRFKVL